MKNQHSSQIEITTKKNKEILELLSLRILYGYMGVHERIQAEILLKKLQEITEYVRQIKTYDDARQVKDLIKKEISTNHNTEEEKVVLCIHNILDKMSKAIIFYQNDEFDFLKEQILLMLEFDREGSLLK